MKQQLLTLVLFFIVATSFAQVGQVSLKEYASLKERTLIVVVEEPFQNLATKLDATQLDTYKKEIEEYNTLVKEAVDSYYKLGNPVEYKSVTETMDIISKKDKKYAYLSFTKFRNNYHTKAAFDLTQKNRIAKDQTRLTGAVSIDYIVSLLEIRFAEESVDALPIYGQYFPSPFPDKVDMVYALRQIVSVLNERAQGIDYNAAKKQLKQDASKAQSQTLLVVENTIGPKEDRSKFISSYKFPLEITTQEKTNDAIISGNAQYLCALTVPMHNFEEKKVEFKFIMYDCGTGKTVATSASQGEFGISTGGMAAFKALKKATTESKVPPIKKENMADFNNAVK